VFDVEGGELRGRANEGDRREVVLGHGEVGRRGRADREVLKLVSIHEEALKLDEGRETIQLVDLVVPNVQLN
jgi:hypothetical protein